jgi:hypothetical protein
MKKLIAVALLATLCWHCERVKPKENLFRQFYNLDSLIDQQITSLHGKTLNKTVSIDGDTNRQVLTFDSTQWQDELGVIKDLDVNLPEYVGGIKTEKSNDVLTYQPLPEQEIPVKQVAYHFDQANQLIKLTGIFEEEKTIYHSLRKIEVLFEKDQIKAYSIKGYQKMLLRDTVYFEVSGEIQLP